MVAVEADAVRRSEGRAMASPLRLTTVGSTRPDEAWTAVRDEFEAAEAAMSRFRPDSEVTRLNAIAGTGVARPLTRRLECAIAATERARRVTGGRFDPRVLGDLVRLGDVGAPISAPIVRGAPGPVMERSADGAVRLGSPVDLGGIGKGLALRWAGRLLDEAGGDYLLEAGGDLVAHGPSPDGGPWRIDMEDPTGASEALAVVELASGALVTSSVSKRRWTVDGRTVHHLLDPRTGEPADRGLLAVTIAGPDPAWAEVWSKTLFIGGAAAIADEARARGFAAWWVSEGGALSMTPAARARTVWVASEA